MQDAARSGRRRSASCTFAAPALAVAAPAPALSMVCVQFDTGGNVGDQILLREVNLGARKFGRVHGYFVSYEDFGPFQWLPVNGQSIAASNGNLLLGLTLHEINITARLETLAHTRFFPTNLSCLPGTDGRIGVLDQCSGNLFGDPLTTSTAHIIPCSDVPPIP